MQQKIYDVKEKEEKELGSISYFAVSNEFENFTGDSLREWKFYENIRVLAKFAFEFLLKGMLISAFGEEQFDTWLKENKKKGHHLEFLFNEFLHMFETSISNREKRDPRCRRFWHSISADTKEDVEERLNSIYEDICKITDSVPVARSFREEDRNSIVNLEAYLQSEDKKLKKLRDIFQTLDRCRFNTNPYSVDGVLILNIYSAAIYLVLLSNVLMNGRTESFYYLINGMSSQSAMKPLEVYIQEARDYLYWEE